MSQPERLSRWDHLQRAALTCVGVFGTVGLLALAGCPADLANPQDYQQAASSGGAPAEGGSGVTKPGLNVDTKCLTDVFTGAGCAVVGCHAAPAAGAAHLDLSSPNVNTRLIDVPATHELVDKTMCKTGDKLVDSAHPEQSWLLLKVTTSMDDQKCGSPMPFGGMLTADQIACVTKYTQDVAAAATAGM